jgi:hypothetical protein
MLRIEGLTIEQALAQGLIFKIDSSKPNMFEQIESKILELKQTQQ